MSQILLTYDVKKTSDTVHTVLKKILIENYGYSPRILASNGKWYDLPNTCLIKTGITKETANTEFLKACVSAYAEWERYIAVEYSGSIFNNQ